MNYVISRYTFLLFAFLSVLLTGCVQQVPPSLDSTVPLVNIGRTDDGGLFAASLSGSPLVLQRKGLVLAEHPLGTERTLSPMAPVVLAWSRDGRILSAGFAEKESHTIVVTYDVNGNVVDEVNVPANLIALEWTSRGELLAVGYQLTVYSFGGNLALKLYRLDGSSVVPIDLGDVTIKPSTVRRFADRLPTLFQVAFSPMGDELVYTRLHDPPEFPPYLLLVYRNWQEFEEHELVRLPVEKVQIDWDNQGESVTISGSEDVEQVIPLWPIGPETAKQMLGAAGLLSVSGRYRFVDGQLFDHDRLLIDWGRGARLQFLTEGQFLLAVDQNLYFGGGLSVEQPLEHDEKRWSLRRWRYHGLITPQEYQGLIQGE